MHRPPDDPHYRDVAPAPSKKPFKITNEARFSWMVALGVLFTYITLAIFGASSIMQMQATKHTFDNVKVSQPVSFFDRSYMVKDPIGPDGSPITVETH